MTENGVKMVEQDADSVIETYEKPEETEENQKMEMKIDEAPKMILNDEKGFEMNETDDSIHEKDEYLNCGQELSLILDILEHQQKKSVN